jgi:hypothetical protein
MITDPQEIEDTLKGKTITGTCQTDESIEIYYEGGVLSICNNASFFVGVNDKLYIEVREDEN